MLGQCYLDILPDKIFGLSIVLFAHLTSLHIWLFYSFESRLRQWLFRRNTKNPPVFIYYSTRIIIIIRLFVEIGCPQNCGWPKHTLDIFFSIVLQNRPSYWVKRYLITAWHPFSCCLFLFDIRSIWFPLTLGGQIIEAGGVAFANFSINFASGSLWFVLYISKNRLTLAQCYC